MSLSAHRHPLWILLLMFTLLLPLIAVAADKTAALTVAIENAQLYAQQDIQSNVVAPLAPGEVLKPLAQGVGTGVWYMVKTLEGPCRLDTGCGCDEHAAD